ncbi:uncharacterized protein LOC101864373, partial [Aplysia californica]|uniref:Uncharacterized protein LOC101864373 n=1 Tax=Aplysia californica TaxID=6500 RepID=A0ABM0ZWJ1_APLCA
MKPRAWIIVTLIFIALAAALQIGGVVAPMWVWLEDDNFNVGVGLFFRVGCETACINASFNYLDVNTRDRTYWIHLIWLETLAACLAILLIVMMMVYLCGFGRWKMSGLNTTMVVTALLAWLCIAVGLILFIVFNGIIITRSPDVSSVSFPWSAFMCFFAGIFYVIISMLIRCRCRTRRYVKNAIPTSGDSKMALNPSTGSQLVRRFFTPSPYREERRQ